MALPEFSQPSFTAAFTTAQAAALGITRTQLQGDTFRQIFRGVWALAGAADTRELRLQAARLLMPQYGTLCGLTAAWMYGADVRRLEDLDVHVGFLKGQRVRKRPGINVCQETLDRADIALLDGTQITTPIRTAFDCLRWLRWPEGVVVADALAHLELLSVEELASYFADKKRLRNLRIGERQVEHIEPKSESPMETRLRIALTDGGLPRPKAQHEVCDRFDNFVGRLDLAYVEEKVGVEYDGSDHFEQRREDDRRRAALRRCGWQVEVYSAKDVFQTPWVICNDVRAALRSRQPR